MGGEFGIASGGNDDEKVGVKGYSQPETYPRPA